MRDNYDFSDSITNPYYHRLKTTIKKQPLILYLDEDIVTWYQSNKQENQAKINTLLREYIKNN